MAERECASLAIIAQLKGIVAKEGIICELSILSQLDKIVYGQGGRVGRQNPIGLWVALWILILSYQERMLYCVFGHGNREIKLFLRDSFILTVTISVTNIKVASIIRTNICS